jgi:hypothetical protein
MFYVLMCHLPYHKSRAACVTAPWNLGPNDRDDGTRNRAPRMYRY